MPWDETGVEEADDPEVGLELELDDTVGEGAPRVEDGDKLFRQLLSSDTPTNVISELPPGRPCESVMENIIDVPRITLAFQVNDVGPTGGFNSKAVPPGTKA